jgi:ribosomal protein S27AE
MITNFKEEYFYSLIRPKAVRKNRRCLRCRGNFESFSASHRICGVCVAANRRVGPRALEAHLAP